MDIVDINKVLDDLEFNEEQHSKSTKTPARNDSLTNKQPDLYATYKYTAASGPASVSTAAVMSPRIPKTNFVKVSNVFNR